MYDISRYFNIPLQGSPNAEFVASTVHDVSPWHHLATTCIDKGDLQLVADVAVRQYSVDSRPYMAFVTLMNFPPLHCNEKRPLCSQYRYVYVVLLIVRDVPKVNDMKCNSPRKIIHLFQQI